MNHKSKLIALAASPFCLLSAAYAAPPTASLTEPADFRIVEGTTPSSLSYTVADTGAADQDLDFSILQYTLGVNPAKEYGSLISLRQGDPAIVTALNSIFHTDYTLNSGGTANLSVLPDISGLSAGNIVNLGVQMNGAGWDSPVNSNTSINVVENRLLTGSTTINSGRHIAGQVGTLTLNGGSLSHTEGTDITVNSGGFAYYGNGIRLTSGSDFTFNTAGQTHNLQVGYYGALGDYTESITLTGSGGANNYHDASGADRSEFGGYWRTETEYGNVLGDTETRVTGQQLSISQIKGDSGVFVPKGSTNNIERNSNLVGTSQPTVPANVDIGLLDIDRGAGTSVNQRINPLITGESVQGGNLDLSGVSLTVTGTVLQDRSITASSETGTIQTYLGRQMTSASVQSVDQAGAVTYTSAGSDDMNTRLKLSNFNVDSGDGITAEYTGGDQDFTGVGGQEAVVNYTAVFDVDRSVTGTHYRSLSSGPGSISTLENGGAGLTGENVQSGLGLTYTWSNVENNQISIADQHVYLFDDENLSSRSLSAEESHYHANGGSSHRVNGTDTHTALGVDDSISLTGTRSVGSVLESTINVNSGNGRVSGEGLSGEVVSASDSFDVYTHTIGRAEANIDVASGSTLNSGDVVTIENVDRGLATQASLKITPKGYTGSDRWSLAYVGNTELAAGESATMTAVFDASNLESGGEGGLGGSYTSVFQFEHRDSFDVNSHLAGLMVPSDRIADGGYLDTLSTATNYTYALKRVVEQTASSGSANYAAGSKLSDVVPRLTNAATTTSSWSNESYRTRAEILDSERLGSNAYLDMTFTKSEEQTGVFAGASGEFAADVIGLEGLDTVKHVISLTYDPTSIGGASEEELRLIWLTSHDADPAPGDQLQDVWVNAVLGNSDIEALNILGALVTVDGEQQAIATYLDDRRYSGSYLSYLNEIGSVDPELGAWGVDTEGNTVWAVVDHNSSFSSATGGLLTVVPEPSSAALLGLGGIALLIRRRR